MIQFLTQVPVIPIRQGNNYIIYNSYIAQPQMRQQFYTPRVQPQPIPQQISAYKSFPPQTYQQRTIIPSNESIITQNQPVMLSHSQTSRSSFVNVQNSNLFSTIIVQPKQKDMKPKWKKVQSRQMCYSNVQMVGRTSLQNQQIQYYQIPILKQSQQVQQENNQKTLEPIKLESTEYQSSAQQTPKPNNQNISHKQRFLQRQETLLPSASPFQASKCSKIKPINFTQLLENNDQTGKNSEKSKKEMPNKKRRQSTEANNQEQKMKIINDYKRFSSIFKKKDLYYRKSVQLQAA